MLTWVLQTDKAAYILISHVVQGRAQTTLERKMPLVTIKSVGLSQLRDDWIVGHFLFVKNETEG